MQSQRKRGRGRPAVGERLIVRFTPEYLNFARKYAAEHTDGNLNAALRELGEIGRAVVEQREQTHGAAA